ncbi:Pyruvate dehydrogenase E1 component [Candidatus Johnevansia muelleri]|uniref:Pyruvate dehydrogenase E1 component n=1 Tax=Candidatus Johnevansia muelleri TaxID=1495769 RepID=A0A078KI35_9GAMM|nr:Pyruvate dehydrogenase E1 component [Candidatus Evansia muelleri]
MGLENLNYLENNDWIKAFKSIIFYSGNKRALFILKKLINFIRYNGIQSTIFVNTHHRNTISIEKQVQIPGDMILERKIRSAIRWNSMALVVKANIKNKGIGGHIASYMSICTLYEVGFNHFFRAANNKFKGDLIYFQGHSSPGIYARSYLEGRFSKEQMDNFRQEINKNGLSSYPHPYLMPEYWQFPTVSMGLGPIQAIYQARFMKYLHIRGIENMVNRKVWAFIGDGECDEVETLGAIQVASREKLNNLIFVINCNLQRLDGLVRGNSRIMDEIEAIFTGAQWKVIKVVWGSKWDKLFKTDYKGFLQKRLNEIIDGECQNFKSQNGKYIREKIFGKYKETAKLVELMSDEEIIALDHGGHDPKKIYAAYYEAVNNTEYRPTVILAHTIKGYGMGGSACSMNVHNIKSMSINSIKLFRDRFNIPISDDKIKIDNLPYYKPAENSLEMLYLHEKRKNLNGYLPKRNYYFQSIIIPSLEDKIFYTQIKGTGNRKISTTMAFVRILSSLLKDKIIGSKIVPIIPDEARTFGLECLFRQVGIYSPEGQKYKPIDANQLMYYREDKKGQLLEEGINEAGAMASWISAATSYSNYNETLIPFYIFYSMFGFQRIGDLAWAAGDLNARGFLLGGTSGRTTLNGEGLQHQDGHGHLLALTIPNCISYDPTYAYELAVIIQYGLKRMYQYKDNCYYYLSIMNENYYHPKMPNNCETGIIKGMYLLHEFKNSTNKHIQLLGSGTILREVEYAAKILFNDFNVTSDVWSVTSFNELRKEALEIDKKNFLNFENNKTPWIIKCLENRKGPIIASTDYMKLYADQIRAWVKNDYYVLGTDGFGMSDTRENLRKFFEIDRYFITIFALKALYNKNIIDINVIKLAIKKYGINNENYVFK